MGLSNDQQAALMFLAFVLPAFGIWLGLGMPTDKAALGLLGSNVIAGIIAAIKEALGGKAPQSPA